MQKRAKLYGRITLARYTLYEGGKRLTKKYALCEIKHHRTGTRIDALPD